MDRRLVMALVEELAPLSYAAPWDNCGLQVGSPAGTTTAVAVAVNPSFEAARFAVSKGCNLLITHHPLLFKALKQLPTDREPGRTAALLMAHDVTAYAAHTNLDATACNRRICDLMGWEFDRVLDPQGQEALCKIAVFVPSQQSEAVARAMWEAGAGPVSGSDLASSVLPAEGTFRARGTAGALPRLHTVEGTRLEVVAPAPLVADVLAAMRRVHPHENVSHEVVRLETGGKSWGLGLYGDLSQPMAIGAIAEQVRHTLNPRTLRLVGDRDRLVTRIGVCSGSGGDLAHRAADLGVDLFITGEIRYHTALEARDRNLALLEVGHQASEEPVVDVLVGFLQQRLPASIRVDAFREPEPFEVV